MKFHPLSELFPLMQGREFDELVADIKANGIREPVWVIATEQFNTEDHTCITGAKIARRGDGAWYCEDCGFSPGKIEYQILDGRNRWRACEVLGWEPPIREYMEDDPAEFVWSLNYKRRHLDESQRAIAVAKYATLRRGRPSDNPQICGITAAEAAEKAHVSVRTVETARKVVRDGASELVHAVESGRVSVSAAADVAELPKDEQREIVARGEKEILEAAKQIRTKRASEVEAKNQQARREALEIQPPTGQFRTVVIDPPWPMAKIDRDVRPNQVGMDYPTMSLEELADLPLPLADDSHVYVWTTQKFLPEALKLLSAWGLKYVFTMVWHKSGGPQPYNLPQYNCEFVVFGRKGNLDFLETKQFFTAFNAPRREHSRKPDEFYELVKRVSPGPHIDMFSREPREGFEQFGNETKKFA